MADASKQQTVAQRVWAEARRSVFYGVIVLLVALVVFGTFVKSMPKFKVGNARGAGSGGLRDLGYGRYRPHPARRRPACGSQ